MLLSIMDRIDPRQLLDRLIAERGMTYAQLSRLLGKNPAYIQQYIKRSIPRVLGEEVRRNIARIFAVSERMLGAPEASYEPSQEKTSGAAMARDIFPVPIFNVQASAGPGALVEAEEPQGYLALPESVLRRASHSGDLSALSVITVRGDSMLPTLADGDLIVVDRADAADRLRDGVYVLRSGDLLNVKRISRSPVGNGFSVTSDNQNYPPFLNCDPAELAIIGRVVMECRFRD